MPGDPADPRHMARFWDERAREDAFYFVDDRLEYGRPDEDRFWAGGEAAVEAILRTLDVTVSPGDVVVDLGCGLGRLTRALAARGAHVVAVDVSAEMLERARALNADLDVEWVQGDGISLRPLPDASADGVLSHVVFQHVPDPAITYGYVEEMGRVLRPGGWAAFQAATDPQIHRGRALVHRLRAMAGRAPRGQSDPAWVGSSVDLDELARAAGQRRLEVERVAGAGTQFCLVLLRQRTAR